MRIAFWIAESLFLLKSAFISTARMPGMVVNPQLKPYARISVFMVGLNSIGTLCILFFFGRCKRIRKKKREREEEFSKTTNIQSCTSYENSKKHIFKYISNCLRWIFFAEQQLVSD
jgi:hypothetical protein